MQEQRIDTAKIEQLRRKRQARKRRTAALIIVAIALIAAYFTGIYGASLSVLADVVDTIAISINRGNGWPQQHTVSRLKAAENLSGGVVMLGDSDVVIYSPTGKLLRSIQHGYGYPAISAGNTRICLYNRSGKELKIESRSRTLSTIVTEQPISLAKMSSGGSFAVVTGSTRYAAELTVYNSLFDTVFSWYSAEDSPITVAINANGTNIAAGCIRPQDGGLMAVLYMFKTSSDVPIATIQTDGAMPLMLNYLSNGDLMAIYDSFAAVYSGKDGAEKARYSYDGQMLQTAEINGKTAVLLFGSETQEDLTYLTVLDESMQAVVKTDIGRIVTDVNLTKTNIFVVLQQSVLSYNFEGVLLGETPVNSNAFTVINAQKLLTLTDTELLELEVPKLSIQNKKEE